MAVLGGGAPSGRRTPTAVDPTGPRPGCPVRLRSWSEFCQNALRSSRDWAGATCEEAEGKSFWDACFAGFGISRRAVASSEGSVRNRRGQYGYIDLFWKGVLLVEHKSLGKDLGKAGSQAFSHRNALIRSDRREGAPRDGPVSRPLLRAAPPPLTARLPPQSATLLKKVRGVCPATG